MQFNWINFKSILIPFFLSRFDWFIWFYIFI